MQKVKASQAFSRPSGLDKIKKWIAANKRLTSIEPSEHRRALDALEVAAKTLNVGGYDNALAAIAARLEGK